MKTFDLTFNGAVLPDYDREQVKRDFALLFSIEDRSVIEDIFSGETLVLRHNLDRKTAADYFRKITQLGGQATLVNSNERGAGSDLKVGKLEQVDGGATRIIREPGAEQEANSDSPFRQAGGMHRSWPISTASNNHHRPELDRETVSASDSNDDPPATPIPKTDNGAPGEVKANDVGIVLQQKELLKASDEGTTPEGVTHTSLSHNNDEEELNKLQALAARTKNELQQKAAELQQQKEQILSIVADNLDKIELLNQTTLSRNKQAITELQTMEEKENLATAAIIARTKEQEKQARERAELEIDRLEALKTKTREGESTEIKNLDQCREETRITAAQDIRRLRQLLREARCQVEVDLAALDQQLEDITTKTSEEISALDEQKAEILRTLEEETRELQQEQAAAKQHKAENISKLQELIKDARCKEEEDIIKLQAMKQEIKQKRVQGIAEVDESNARLIKRTKKRLKQLRAQELKVKHRLSNALSGQENHVSEVLPGQKVS